MGERESNERAPVDAAFALLLALDRHWPGTTEHKCSPETITPPAMNGRKEHTDVEGTTFYYDEAGQLTGRRYSARSYLEHPPQRKWH